MSRAFAVACLYAVLAGCSVAAQDSTKVWLNAASGVYHCAGSEHYGKTARGSFLSERDATAKGYRPAGGTACTKVSRSAAALDSGPQRPTRATTECIVTRIIDGDTIDCRGAGRVRFLGIDAPEMDQRPFGPTAARELAALVPVGSRAQLEQDVEARDRNGRTLAYLWLNGKQVNWTMLRSGWAVVLTYPPNVRYADYLVTAQRRARDEKRGLWRVNGFGCLPSDHRQQRC